MLVIGGGAAGMMAAIRAAELGVKVHILEKNEKLGKKLYITGKGRCNLTNACSESEFIEHIRDNPKFLISSYLAFDNKATMSKFEELKVPLVIERGNRVFPASGKSSDIITALRKKLEILGVSISYNTEVISVQKSEDKYVVKTHTQSFCASTIIIATGGITYKATGSTGDGYMFASSLDLKVNKPYPSLVGLVVEGTRKLSGLTLKNVKVSAIYKNKVIACEFGELLYTHIGLSGPTILTLSSYINRIYANVVIEIDLKSALSHEQLDKRILSDFSKNNNKTLINAMDKLLPKSLIEEVINMARLDKNVVVNQITKQKRTSLVDTIKALRYEVKGLDDINNAIITSGGVCCKELNPRTLESKKHNGLYFAGEVIDISALTGGYNLQIAWSTGFAAGEYAAKYELKRGNL